jgi:hypothetical protein
MHPVGSYCTDISEILNPGRNLCGNIISQSTEEREMLTINAFLEIVFEVKRQTVVLFF